MVSGVSSYSCLFFKFLICLHTCICQRNYANTTEDSNRKSTLPHFRHWYDSSWCSWVICWSSCASSTHRSISVMHVCYSNHITTRISIQTAALTFSISVTHVHVLLWQTLVHKWCRAPCPKWDNSARPTRRWDNSAQDQLDAGDSARRHFGAASVTVT